MAETDAERLAQHAGKAHYYNPAKNPDGAYLPGVPMRDLSADDWDGLSTPQQEAVLYHGFWRLTPVPRESADAAPAEESAPAPRRRAERGPVESSTAGSNAVPTPDAGPPNPVGAEEAGS